VIDRHRALGRLELAVAGDHDPTKPPTERQVGEPGTDGRPPPSRTKPPIAVGVRRRRRVGRVPALRRLQAARMSGST
jgi:hypothetical protein